jgi:hypothetical protein
VRQLLGDQRHTMRQLNNALDDALAGFDFVEEEDDLVIDETPRKVAAAVRSSPIKLKLNVAKQGAEAKAKAQKAAVASRATLEDLKMTKAHQVCWPVRESASCRIVIKMYNLMSAI